MHSPISSHNPEVFTVNLNVQINGRENRRINNPEISATPSTQGTGQRQTKHNSTTYHRKLKR